MSRTQVFPALLILLDLAASAVCAMDGDARRAIYWAAAAVLTTVMTF